MVLHSLYQYALCGTDQCGDRSDEHHSFLRTVYRSNPQCDPDSDGKPDQCVYFVIFVIILQQFDGNILGPKILGNTTNLSSFWVCFDFAIMASDLESLELVIGVPVFAFIYQLIREWVLDRLEEQKLQTQKKE